MCRVRMQDGVAIDTDEDFVVCRRRAGAQPHGLALVGLEVNHSKPVFEQGHFIEYLPCLVVTRVVDGYDLEVRVNLFEQRAYGLAHIGAFVMTRHDKGDTGRFVERRRIIDRPFLHFLSVEEVIDGTHHPQIGHEERIEKGEVE